MTQAHPDHLQSVLETLSYVRKFSGETVLIKLGGAALQDSGLVRSLCEDFALLRSLGITLVLVHGGGPSINQELIPHGIEWSFVQGQRVTTPQMMDVVEMVLNGSVNSRLVRTLNNSGVPAIGLSGADGGLIQCKRAREELGQVGVVEAVNTELIQKLLDAYVPVIAPVGVGKSGEAYNVNADWAAIHVAVALAISKVVYLTNQDGILDGSRSVISELDAAGLEHLIETGVVQGGMLAKAQTMLHGLKQGVRDIHILNARNPHGLIEELYTKGGRGTVCRVRSIEGGMR